MEHTFKKTVALISCVALALLSAACDLGPGLAAAQDVISTLSKNKSLAEDFVTDIKKDFAPEDPQYSTARTLYEQARGLTNDYVGKVALAALTNDQSATINNQAEAAHAAQTTFVETATRSLSPKTAEDRSIVFGLVMAALPAIAHRIFATVPASQRPGLVHRFSDQAHWRSWDEIQ